MSASKIEINQKLYSVESSSSKGSVLKAFSDYSNTGSGIYKTLGVIGKVFEAIVRSASLLKLTPGRVIDFSDVSSYIASSRELLIVTTLTSHTLKQFFENIGKCISGSFNLSSISELGYAVIELTRDVTTFVGLFRVPAAAKFLLTRIGACLSFIKTSWDIQKAYSKYSLCQSLQKKVLTLKGDAKANFETYIKEKKRELMLEVASCVLDIAVSVLLFASFIVGFAVAPVIAIWGLEAASLGFDFASGVYEHSMTYDLKEEKKNH